MTSRREQPFKPENHVLSFSTVYTNVDDACRLTAPQQTWTLEDKSKPGTVTVRFKPPNAEEVHSHFVAFALPAVASPKMVIKGRLNLFESNYKRFAVINDQPQPIRGGEGHQLVFRRADEDDPEVTIKTTEFVWRRGSHGYLLNLIAEESAHQKVAITLDPRS